MPHDPIFWEPEPNRRGTFSIFITCFTTLGISLWSSLHLSIPRRRRNWKTNLGVKILWLSFALFLPEILIVVAAEQREGAHRIRDKVNGHFEPHLKKGRWYRRLVRKSTSTSTADEERDEVRTLVGDAPESPKRSSIESSSISEEVKSNSLEVPGLPNEQPTPEQVLTLPVHKAPSGRHRWTLTHGFFAVMGGFGFYDSTGELRILKAKAIKELLQTSPELVPDLSVDTILNLNKADGLAKALLFTQVGWFCVACIGRLAQGLPLTLLEVSTLTHALCAMVIYILWWDKPLNIEEPIIISNPGPLRDNEKWLRTGDVVDIEFAGSDGLFSLLIPLFSVPFVYGVPHLMAWNSYFATRAEQLLWRISACAVTATPLVLIILVVIYATLIPDDNTSYMDKFLIPLTLASSIFVYFPASLFLIGESLRQLFHLPPDAFATTPWAEYFPHL